MTTEEKIRDILTNYGCDLDNSYPESKAIEDILKVLNEEKIKLLEGLKYKRKNKLYNLTSSQLNSYRIKMEENERLNLLISELREEGKEKL